MTSTRSAILLYNRVGACIGRWRRYQNANCKMKAGACFVDIQWIQVYRICIYGYGYIHGYPRKIYGLWIWMWNFISTATLHCIVQRRRYCDEFEMVYVCVGMVGVRLWQHVWVGKAGIYTTKTPDRNDLKLGVIVVGDTVSQPTNLGFKRTRLRVRVRFRFRESAPNGISRECTFHIPFR